MALIAGPTASGKSTLALALAEKHRGTVINADSMQVYADLRILTARPTRDEETRVPHRLFGHVDGADSYSAARWAIEARAAIAEAHQQHRLPILVGGTGLYLRTLIEGIAPVPEIDAAVRSAVRALPVGDAHAALAAVDPEAAGRLNATDTTRVARALEVVRSTGKPLAQWQQQRVGGIAEEIHLAPLILLPDREWLGERIDTRFAEMLEAGRSEAKALLARTDIPADAPVLRAIGVPELRALFAGETDVVQAAAAGALATRQYAKRQYTWFRRQPPADWQKTDATEMNVRMHLIETKFHI